MSRWWYVHLWTVFVCKNLTFSGKRRRYTLDQIEREEFAEETESERPESEPEVGLERAESEPEVRLGWTTGRSREGREWTRGKSREWTRGRSIERAQSEPEVGLERSESEPEVSLESEPKIRSGEPKVPAGNCEVDPHSWWIPKIKSVVVEFKRDLLIFILSTAVGTGTYL